MMDLTTNFVDNGVYKLKNLPKDIFLCSAVQGYGMGKLVRYENVGSKTYRETNMCYFISCYAEDDIKALFIDRNNYDMLGMLDKNYIKRGKTITRKD